MCMQFIWTVIFTKKRIASLLSRQVLNGILMMTIIIINMCLIIIIASKTMFHVMIKERKIIIDVLIIGLVLEKESKSSVQIFKFCTETVSLLQWARRHDCTIFFFFVLWPHKLSSQNLWCSPMDHKQSPVHPMDVQCRMFVSPVDIRTHPDDVRRISDGPSRANKKALNWTSWTRLSRIFRRPPDSIIWTWTSTGHLSDFKCGHPW